MDWHGRNKASFVEDDDQLSFEPRVNTVVDCHRYAGHSQSYYRVQRLSDSDLRRWLHDDECHVIHGNRERGVRIVISNRVSNTITQPNDDVAALTHLSFSRETFLDLMIRFQLSHSFVRTILRGDADFSCTTERTSAPALQPLQNYNMRMDHAFSRDLAMSASGNTKTAMSYALFHGCDEQDVGVLIDWLSLTGDSVGHPLLLPALFAEMQLRRHRRFTKKNWKTLVTQYAQTGQYGGTKQGDSLDYEKATREVLTMHQSTGFLEKDLVQFRRRLSQMKALLTKIAGDVPESQRKFIAKEGTRIGERLDEMINEYESLIAECRRVTEGASLLTGAIWNLIAQRDNIAHKSIAADSRKIAAAARRDSSAMKTIAVLTMAFLPGTFVAAFFAMPLFNWDAPAGASVLLDRFRIYWAVTLPLTATLFLLWSTWYVLLGSQKAQDRKEHKSQSVEHTANDEGDYEHPFFVLAPSRLRKIYREFRGSHRVEETNHEMQESQAVA